MPYFIDPGTSTIFVGGFYGDVNPTFIEINSTLANQLELRHGQTVNQEQIAALRNGSAEDFRARQSSAERLPTPAPAQSASAAAPPGTYVATLPASVNRASSAAGIVEGFTWLILVLTVIGGLVIAAQTSYDGYETTHPYVGLGIGIAIGGSINCLMIIMVAAYIKAKMELARIGR